MVIAALVCFAILLLAWIVAPTEGPRVAAKPVVRQDPDLQPLLEAA
jgi:hypothetical protein